MIVMIDNYDSFTYNLVQYLRELSQEVCVQRNDALSVDAIQALRPSHIVISPGPGRPEQSGVCPDIIRQLAGKIPILGVCLGHQTIGMVYGASIIHAPTLMHGKVSPIYHDGKGVFKGIPSPFNATRYHSLVIDPQTTPKDFDVSARTQEGVIMGIRHKTLPLEGVQFHPESILTEHGHALLKNFLDGDCL